MGITVTAKAETINLRGTDIAILVETIAQVTGKNFILDPRVKGNVTVISSKDMSPEAVYQVFLSILQVHGFAAVEAGEVVKILPDVNAKQSAPPIATRARPGMDDDLVTRVIEVQNVPAAQLVPVLRPLIPQQGHLAAYAPSNVLIISDRAGNIDRMLKLIKRVDRAGTAEIEVISMEHASAAEVVRIITNLNQGANKQDPNAADFKVVADERTNSVLMGGDESIRLRMRGLIAHLDTPLESGGNTHVIYLRYAKAKELVTVLTGIGSSITTEQGGAKKEQASAISIQADESSNALVITAPPDIVKSLRSVVQQLDVRRAQVAVEAIIAELSASKAAELGVQFAIGSGLENGSGIGGATTFSGNALGGAVSSTNPLGFSNGLTVGVLDGTLSIPGIEGSFLNIRALARALRADTDTNVLSTPTLMTLDNEEAEIVVGQNVPFLTGQFTNTGATDGATNPFQTIQRQDVGVTLKVKPQINEGDAIKLDIEQEVSSIAPATSSVSSSDIITNKRSIKTSVLVDDGQILVLGGLIEDRYSESEDKVPVLGDLPLLGALFRYSKTTKDKQNLMVFIRPSIIRSSNTGDAVSSAKYNFIRARQLDERAKGVSLMSEEESPILPTIEDYQRLYRQTSPGHTFESRPQE